jgi:aminopeptidase N
MRGTLVSGNNLTRAEAAERARLLAVDAYVVDWNLTSSDVEFDSTTAVNFACSEPGASTFIEVIAASVSSIELNGRSIDPASVTDGSRIRLDDLAAANELRIVARCLFSRTGEGMHRFVDPVDKEAYVYTQFETADAKRAFACFDQPDLKATFAFSVTAPSHWQVVSNEPAGEPATVEPGVSHWVFDTTPRMSPYITAFVGGPYHVVRDSWERPGGGSIPLGVFCRASLGAYLDADEIIEITKQGFAFFEEQFARPYPFAKYDQLFVPEFNAGAMENAGAVTFLEDYVFRSKVTQAARDARANTILHEMAHMWFGDLVTMRWWDDLWLNESFAEFMAYHAASTATRFTDAWTGFATSRKAWGYRQDQLPSTHPIAADAPDLETAKANFDGITYAKGASVLKQLVAWVGLEHFMAGVRTYFDKHAWGNTRLSDLLTELEATSGRDLAEWSKEWLQTAGCNTLRPSFELAANGSYTSFAVEQEAPGDYPTLRSHRIAIGLYDRTDAGLVRRARVETDVVGPLTEVPALVGLAQPDLLLLNDDDLTFAKVRLDERSLASLTASVGELADSLPRALCWSAAWDMTRDAEMRARDFVRLVSGGVGAETDIVTVQSVLRQAAAALDLYVTPDHRDEAKDGFARAMFDLTMSAEPGSDHQLAFGRTLVSVATDSAALDLLDGLLDGTKSVAGLAIDTDLRWSILRRLVATGRRGDAAIDAELDRDDTASGRRHAATVRAGRPTAEAKEEAWAAVVDSDDLPNALQTATIAGFLDADHRELLRPYVERYFESVGPVWAARSAEMASNIVVGLYPALFVEPAVVERTEAYLRDVKPVAAVARLLSEGRDGVQRALRCQAKDATG